MLSRQTAAAVLDARLFDGALYFDGASRYVVVGASPASPDLLAAWSAYPLPAGHIGPSLAQLALLRGEPAAYDDEARRLIIGGRVLVGVAGSIFRFSQVAGADQWLLVNRRRGAGEVTLMAGLPEGAREVARAQKHAALVSRAERVIANAAKITNASIRAALIAEADWYLTKWA